jgi:hypothetical protein
MSVFDRLNQHKYLYLVEITEPADNILKLKLAEAATVPAEDIFIGGIKLKGSELTVTADCAIYEVTFHNYIAYSVRNEAYTTQDEEEEFEGRLFCIYTRSKFLEYVRTATFASDQFPGPFKHFEFNKKAKKSPAFRPIYYPQVEEEVKITTSNKQEEGEGNG